MDDSMQLTIGVLRRIAAARYIGVSIRKLDRLAATGELTRIKIGRLVVYRVRDLEAFLSRMAFARAEEK